MRRLSILALVAGISLVMAAAVPPGAGAAPGPSIQVVPVGDYVDLIGFAPGAVTVTINGTALDPAPDGGSGDERVSLAAYGIDLVAGDVVIASQNGSIAEVTTVHVEITAADPTTGIVTGLAPDGALVNVEAWTDNGSAERVTTASGGAFSVNFSLPGGPSDPNPDVVTLTPGSWLAAFVYDDPHTGDASKHDWQVPEVAGDFGDVVGHWVGIDAEGSFWRLSFGAQGNFNSIDSATFPCENSRTRLWGDTTAADENLYVVDFSLRCLNGPLSGTVIPDFGEFEFNYDPGTNTLILDQPEPFDDSVFCRRPCDPYVYFSG